MKSIILKILELQTKRFFKRFGPKLVVITGSVGKTSTKLYMAEVLSKRYRVMVHYGNHNTHVSVPMAVFNIPIPVKLKSIWAWLGVIWQTQKKLHQPFNYDVIILELGTDHPGEIEHFGTYLSPHIAVVTAVTPEHMEFFKTLDAVAKEELAAANFSMLALVNRDDIDGKYSQYVTNSNIDTYGTSGVAEYHFMIENFDIKKGFSGKFVSPEHGEQKVSLQLVGEHNVKAAVAAGVVGAKLGMTASEIVAGMQSIQPVNGRMRMLRGLKDTVIIDDTYNSSPRAALAAIQTLYSLPGKQKIAILGSMNELGDYSKEAHEQVGKLCDPTLLDWVITIGNDAQKYLAPAAELKGCQVRSFASPYDAGAFAHSVLHPHAIVLAKGSQNGVFAEEALKILLHSTDEEHQLVRQEPEWLDIKEKQFEKFKQAQS
ncbi:MAG: Mur ligase family protein [Candidatus Woesebacteria bacterium]|jgi:UDP-N-acetylmuramoyl-tripeptide--D-alanyl-D-alanine ligase